MLDVMTLFDTKYVVSIHALRFQRAMRHRHRHWLPWQGFNPRPPFPEGDAMGFSSSIGGFVSFNPRPPFPEGDASPWHPYCHHRRVSIHALRFQRAMQLPASRGDVALLFQSTPSVSRGRCAIAPRMIPTESMFQSTPSVSRGRCHAPSSSPTTKYSFNPRPPFPEGDARRPSGSI